MKINKNFLLFSPLLIEYGFVSASSAKWYQTSITNDDRLTEKTALEFTFEENANSDTYHISIDTSTTFQTLLGFGGALTQSSATVYKTLSKDLQEEMIEAYYGPTGIGYTTGRLPIHSCDFSEDVYTFDDIENDINLKYFDNNVTYDQSLSIPLIQDALKSNPDLLLFGSPWSPPAWMKTNNNMLHGGKLLDEYRQTWALYFSKWIEAYEAQGIPLWGITIQNEPEAVQTWESCIYTPEETRDFVTEYLGPQLNSTHPHVKIFGYDHNKANLEEWADALIGTNSSSVDYVDGIAFHWYDGSCFDSLNSVYNKYPDTVLLPSEATFELTVLEDDESDSEWLVNGTWSKGEGYGFDIMGDLEFGAVGWTDWNILLDSTGGPNHVDNYCDAPIIAETVDNNNISNAIYYHPQYYYLGHFSKYLLPGSTRVETTITQKNQKIEPFGQTCGGPYGGCNSNDIQVTSWQLPPESHSHSKPNHHQTAIVIMNCGDTKDFSLSIKDMGGKLRNTIPKQSIQTYIVTH